MYVFLKRKSDKRITTMYTKKSNQNSDNRINSSVDTSVKPMDNEGLNTSIRYATINTSVTILIVLIVTQLLNVTLINGVLVSSVLSLTLFIWTFNKGIDLSRIENVIYSASYDSQQETLQQKGSIPITPRVEIGHTATNSSGYDKWVLDILDVDMQALQALSSLLIEGKPFNRPTCQLAGISQNKWDSFKGSMLELGYIMPNSNGNKQGYVTTAKGNATFKHLATLSPTLAISDQNGHI